MWKLLLYQCNSHTVDPAGSWPAAEPLPLLAAGRLGHGSLPGATAAASQPFPCSSATVGPGCQWCLSSAELASQCTATDCRARPASHWSRLCVFNHSQIVSVVAAHHRFIIKLWHRVSVCSPVIHVSLVQHTVTITDDRVEDLLPAEHFCLKWLRVHTHTHTCIRNRDW